jgi:tRNA pseudouridine65 synthase
LQQKLQILENRVFTPFELIYEDEHLVAINKPWGILVHRTGLSEDRVFVLQLLRDQLGGQHLFPAHRLDRGTSGVLLFGKNHSVARQLGEQIMDKQVAKRYLAITRGWPPPEGTIDYALEDKETRAGQFYPAITHFKTLKSSHVELPIGLRYPTARFSLVEIFPETGRRQQIRKHFSHLRYPIIGDSRHGDVKQNNYFKMHFDSQRMFLHAHRMRIKHPVSGMDILLEAGLDKAFELGLRCCGLEGELG